MSEETYTENETLARRLYPDVDWDESYLSGCYAYEPMVEDVGKIVLWHMCGDYQGDYHVLIEGEGGDFGYVSIGYGSCSGCDALQQCDTAEQIGDLAASVQREIHWEADVAAMKKWLLERDWEVSWCWHYEEFKDFLREALAHVGAEETEIGELFLKFDAEHN